MKVFLNNTSVVFASVESTKDRLIREYNAAIGTDVHADKVKALLDGLDNEGLLDKFDCIYPFLGSTKSELSKNLMNVNSFNAVFADNIQFGENKVTSATYDKPGAVTDGVEKIEHTLGDIVSIFGIVKFNDTHLVYNNSEVYFINNNTSFGAKIGGISVFDATYGNRIRKVTSAVASTTSDQKIIVSVNNGNKVISDDFSNTTPNLSNIIGYGSNQYAIQGELYFHAAGRLSHDEALRAKPYFEAFVNAKGVTIDE